MDGTTFVYGHLNSKSLFDNCNVIHGEINENGFIEVNQDLVLKTFLNPKPFVKEERILNFFSGR